VYRFFGWKGGGVLGKQIVLRGEVEGRGVGDGYGDRRDGDVSSFVWNTGLKEH